MRSLHLLPLAQRIFSGVIDSDLLTKRLPRDSKESRIRWCVILHFSGTARTNPPNVQPVLNLLSSKMKQGDRAKIGLH